MVFSYDKYKRQERPHTYLAYPNGEHIGTLKSRELETDLCFNNISSGRFIVNKYEDGIPTEYYDKIENLKLVEISYVGWFQITGTQKLGNGLNEYIEVKLASLESEATSKTLTSFGQMGTEDDEQGGLDRYRLYDISDVAHSIIHIWLQKMPSWTVGYIDPDITTQYRTFTNDEVGAYSFLVNDVSTTFECIFQFDTFNQAISAYKLENIGDVTSIYLSYDNLIKSVQINSDFSDIKTVYTVAGGDDRGSTLNIIQANPAGNNQISNWSYYKSWMSEALRLKLDAYEIEYESRQTNFAPALGALGVLYEELNSLINKLPNVVGSTNWIEYGLKELEVKYNIYSNTMASYINLPSSSQYQTALTLRDAVDAEIKVRKSQISTKETQIVNQKALCESLTLNLYDYLGDTLYKELSRYYHEDTFTDDTFIVTDNMSDDEALEMKRELLAMAQRDLAKRCKPQYSIEVDSINFTALEEFKRYTEQLELGNIITLDFGEGILVESRLLKIHINWDKKDDFSLTFSSKNKLDSWEYQLAEIQSQSNGVTTAYNLSGTGWNVAKNTNSSIKDYMTNTFDLARQKLQSSTNEGFYVDDTGTHWRRFDNNINDYSPKQMWGVSNGLYLTQTAWNTVDMAMGEGTYNGQSLYGIWAKLLCGDMILGNNLAIINDSGTYTINNNGFNATATIGANTYSAGFNPSTPSEIINAKVNGTNVFFIDTVNNRLSMTGNINATSGTLGSLTVTGTLTGGNIYGTNINAATITGTNINGGTITGTTINGSTFIQSSIPKLGRTELTDGEVNTTRVLIRRSDSSGEFKPLSDGFLNMTSWEIKLAQNPSNDYFRADNLGMTVNVGAYFNNGISANSAWITTLNGASAITSSNLSYYMPSTSGIVADVMSSAWIQFNGGRAAGYFWALDTFEPISSSDKRLKRNFKSLDELPDEMFMEIQMTQFEYIEEMSDNGVVFGVIAQQVIEVFDKYGYNALDYNLVRRKKISPAYSYERKYIEDDYKLIVNYQNLFSWGMRILQKKMQ